METGTVPCGAAVADPASGFPRQAPLVLDLGCGNGLLLSALAAREPGHNFLGIEKKEYRVRQSRRRASAWPNVQIAYGEVVETLRAVPDASVARAYLLFSDPWPKRRHATRRLVGAELFRVLERVLHAGGVFFFASDSPDYSAAAGSMTAARPGWSVREWLVPADWPQTEFEQRFTAQGLPVSRFQAVWEGMA